MAEQSNPAEKFFPPMDELKRAELRQGLSQVAELIETYCLDLSKRALPPQTVDSLVRDFAAAVWSSALRPKDGR